MAPSLPFEWRESTSVNLYERYMRDVADMKRKEAFDAFKHRLGFRESGNNPHAVNPLGYIGEWQFGAAALKDVGRSVSIRAFHRDPSIWTREQQEEDLETLINLNAIRLQWYINHFDGKIVRGVLVTKSGILAAAHLAGAKGVMNWFNTGYNPKDYFGTKLTDYMIQFIGYEF